MLISEVPDAASELQRTQFVGRAHELSTVVALLRSDGVRLLTLAGPGGIGKTRLALATLGLARAGFSDGATIVALAGVRDPGLLEASLGIALGLRSERGEAALELVVGYLRDRKMLILLDNFEQLLPVAGVLSQLLDHAPGLKLLVTSRSRLHLAAEHVFVVSPLARNVQ